MNLASRLTDAAAAGIILIADAVRHMLPPGFTFDEAGTLAVKGLAEPVRAWRLVGIADAAAERPPFVGRRAELAQFQGVLDACRESGAGQTVVVRGEAGIGKTRVVEEFQALAEAVGFACHVGLVLDFGAGLGQDAIRTLVRSLLGLTASTAPAAAQAAAERALSDGLLANEQRVYLNDLLDLPQPTALRALYDAMDNATRNRGKRATVASLVRRLSERQPLLLVVEDVHWADRLTLEHLATPHRDGRRLPGAPGHDLAYRGRSSGPRVALEHRGQPLDDHRSRPAARCSEATALAGAYLDATADFAKRCIERAAGNPLFLEQLLRHAEQSTAGRRAGLGAEPGPGAHGPAATRTTSRPCRLPPSFGQRFALEALRHLLDDPDYDCAPLVRALPSSTGRRRFPVRPRPDP